jgi:FMN phosphatase YigB (HAD superfamily)
MQADGVSTAMDAGARSDMAEERDPAIDWFSIDVFDTVTTRAVASPADLFVIVGRRVEGLVDMRPETFAQLRQDAEAALRRRIPVGGEVTLLAIHEELRRMLPPGASTAAPEAVAAIEADVEVEVARPWPPGLDVLEAWRRRAGFLGFLSDMYLPAETVRRILVAAGAWEPSDALYVSSEEQATKSSGRLFQLLAHRFGVLPGRWTHFGDNIEADVMVPRRLGMQAFAVGRPMPSQRSRNAFRTLGSEADRGPRLRACLQQAAGVVPPGCDPHRRRIWNVGAHVLGPTVAWYAHAVLAEAEKSRIRNLWFLARDGEVISKAAALVNPLANFSGRMHYVLASRQALHLASLTEFDAEAERWILANPATCTPPDVARRLGMQEPLRSRFLEHVGAACAPHEPIARRRADIWAAVRSPSFGDAILALANEQRRACRAYLDSISEAESLGIVDIGWHANLQCSLQNLLARDDIIGFYLGLRGRNPRVGAHCVRPLLFQADSESERRLGSGVAVLEMLFAGSHPGLVRYAFDDVGRPVGILSSPSSWERQVRWGVHELQGGALEAARRLVAEGLVPTRQEVSGLMTDFLEHPSVEEVAALRDWPTQDLQGTDVAAPLVEDVGWTALLRGFLTGHVPRIGHWEAGARVVNGVPRHVAYRALRRAYRRGDR